jgi:hypothetical protein
MTDGVKNSSRTQRIEKNGESDDEVFSSIRISENIFSIHHFLAMMLSQFLINNIKYNT